MGCRFANWTANRAIYQLGSKSKIDTPEILLSLINKTKIVNN
jgi:hypothetical protein